MLLTSLPLCFLLDTLYYFKKLESSSKGLYFLGIRRGTCVMLDREKIGSFHNGKLQWWKVIVRSNFTGGIRQIPYFSLAILSILSCRSTQHILKFRKYLSGDVYLTRWVKRRKVKCIFGQMRGGENIPGYESNEGTFLYISFTRERMERTCAVSAKWVGKILCKKEQESQGSNG